MEENFQFQPLPPLVGGGASSPAVDEAYLNGICAGLSFRSLLTTGSFEPLPETLNLLKMPKTEPLLAIDGGVTASDAPPYKFFSEATSSSLPNLLSFELPQNTVAAVESPIPIPRVETASYLKQPRKRKREKLSDKTRCLQKLLPLYEKMDMATVLEEAHKYIKFLQAQVRVLQSMPCESSVAAAASSIGGGDLGRLNRQQLLQVVMNSPVAQTQLYSKGCCIYSVEQLVLLKKNAERKALMMLGSSNPNSLVP